MAPKLLAFNLSGILFISHQFAEASAFAIDDVETRLQHRIEIRLDPPIKAISRWADDRVIATFQANVAPGRTIGIFISYTGGFYDKKKDLWPVVWQDLRIKNLVQSVVDQLAVQAGFLFDEPLDMFDQSSNAGPYSE